MSSPGEWRRRERMLICLACRGSLGEGLDHQHHPEIPGSWGVFVGGKGGKCVAADGSTGFAGLCLSHTISRFVCVCVTDTPKPPPYISLLFRTNPGTTARSSKPFVRFSSPLFFFGEYVGYYFPGRRHGPRFFDSFRDQHLRSPALRRLNLSQRVCLQRVPVSALKLSSPISP